jgi:hypothetical protein
MIMMGIALILFSASLYTNIEFLNTASFIILIVGALYMGTSAIEAEYLYWLRSFVDRLVGDPHSSWHPVAILEVYWMVGNLKLFLKSSELSDTSGLSQQPCLRCILLF